MKNLLKLFKKSQSSQGWTLLELIIAASLTLVVVGASGFALVAILKNNKIASANSQIKYDLNRAVEFISNEVKSANKVEKNVDINYIKAQTKSTDLPNGFNPGGTVTPILFLKLPQVDTNGNNLRVVYYTRTKDSTIDWIGPKIIYRWGPNLGIDGQYTASLPSAWTYEALIDMIANQAPSDNKNCKNTSGQWLQIPSKDGSGNANGFYICVRSDERMAELHAFGSADVNTTKNPVTYGVETQVYTRTEGGNLVNGLDSTTLTNNSTAPRNVTIEGIAEGLTCEDNTTTVPVYDNVYLGDPGTKDSLIAWTSSVGGLNKVVTQLPSGESLTIAASSTPTASSTTTGTCKVLLVDIPYPLGLSLTTNSSAKTLGNGAILDDLGIDSTSKAKLQSILQPKGYVDASGRVTIANNQLLYFSEIYLSKFYLFKEKTVFPTKADPDFDDYIGLITVNTP